MTNFLKSIVLILVKLAQFTAQLSQILMILSFRMFKYSFLPLRIVNSILIILNHPLTYVVCIGAAASLAPVNRVFLNNGLILVFDGLCDVYLSVDPKTLLLHLRSGNLIRAFIRGFHLSPPTQVIVLNLLVKVI
jgi:hypothetical protein